MRHKRTQRVDVSGGTPERLDSVAQTPAVEGVATPWQSGSPGAETLQTSSHDVAACPEAPTEADGRGGDSPLSRARPALLTTSGTPLPRSANPGAYDLTCLRPGFVVWRCRAWGSPVTALVAPQRWALDVTPAGQTGRFNAASASSFECTPTAVAPHVKAPSLGPPEVHSAASTASGPTCVSG